MASNLIPTPPKTPDMGREGLSTAWKAAVTCIVVGLLTAVGQWATPMFDWLPSYDWLISPAGAAFGEGVAGVAASILLGAMLWRSHRLTPMAKLRALVDTEITVAKQAVDAAQAEAQHYLATQRTFEKVVVPDATALRQGGEVKVHLLVTNEGPDLLTITDASFRLASAGTGIPGERMRFKMENNVQIAPCLRGLVGHVTLSEGAVHFRLDEVQIKGGLPERDTMPRSTSRDVLSVHWLTPEPSDAETSSTPESSTPRP